MMAIGGLLGILIVLVAALLWHSPKEHIVVAPVRWNTHCTRSTYVKVEWFCGNTMVYVNPDGSRVKMPLTPKNYASPMHLALAVR